MTQEIVEVTDEDVDLILNPLRNEFSCNVLPCGYITEDPEHAEAHVKEHHGKSDVNYEKWVAEGARSTDNQHNLLVWAFADGLLFEDEKRPGYIGPDRTDIVGL